MYLRRLLTELIEIEGSDSPAAAMLPKVEFESLLAPAEIAYLRSQLKVAADREGNTVGPAIRILSELADIAA